MTASSRVPLVDVAGIVAIGRPPTGPSISSRMISEKPSTALSGVFNSWLMAARKAAFIWLAISAWRNAARKARSGSTLWVTSSTVPS